MKINQIVELTINDHYFGSAELYPVKVYGKVHQITEDKVVLIVWEPLQLATNEVDSREFIAVIRSSIIKVRRLK